MIYHCFFHHGQTQSMIRLPISELIEALMVCRQLAPPRKSSCPIHGARWRIMGALIVKIISRYPFVCRLIIIMLHDSAYMYVDLCSFQNL